MIPSKQLNAAIRGLNRLTREHGDTASARLYRRIICDIHCKIVGKADLEALFALALTNPRIVFTSGQKSGDGCKAAAAGLEGKNSTPSRIRPGPTLGRPYLYLRRALTSHVTAVNRPARISPSERQTLCCARPPSRTADRSALRAV